MASNAGAIRAGRAFVEIFADDSKMRRVLDRAAGKLKAFGGAVRNVGLGLVGVGAAIAAPLAAAVGTFTNMGSEMLEASQRTGIAVEALSALKFAAEQSGASLSDVEIAVKKMQQSLVKGADGSEEASKALGKIGLKLSDLEGLSPDQQFIKIGSAIAGIADPAERTAAAVGIFGRSATTLAPLFSGGAKGIAEMTARAKELGLVMSTQDAVAAESLGDQFSEVMMILKQAAFTIGSALAPALKSLVEFVTPLIVKGLEWVKQNKGLVVAIAAVAAGVIALGAALVTVGTLFIGIGAAIAGLGVVLGVIFSPLGLIVAAVVALGAGLLHVTGGFSAMKDAIAGVMPVLQGLMNALGKGNFALAWDIAWTGMKLVFAQAIDWVSSKWSDFLGRLGVGGGNFKANPEISQLRSQLASLLETANAPEAQAKTPFKRGHTSSEDLFRKASSAALAGSTGTFSASAAKHLFGQKQLDKIVELNKEFVDEMRRNTRATEKARPRFS